MYTWDWALHLALFATAATFTPGPNVLLLLSIAARFGLRAALPAGIGVCLGIPSVIVVVGAGLAEAFLAVPQLRLVLHVGSTIYLLWLAWGIFTMSPPSDGTGAATPLSSFRAAALQWANPKVWTMAVGAVGAYGAGGPPLLGAVMVGSVFALVCIPAAVTWTLFGTGMRRWLMSPSSQGPGVARARARFLAFKFAMGLALGVSITLTWI